MINRGKTMMHLPAQLKLFIFDIDGTLHVDGQEIAGARALIQTLRDQNYAIRFMTNTTTKSQAMLVEQLENVGIQVEQNEILSASEASRTYLHDEQINLGRKIKIWTVVSENIQADFSEFEQDQQHPDFVVIGDIGNGWNIDLLNQIFNCLNQGAKLIALHKNKFWQTQEGLKVDIGLFVAGLEYVSNQTALIMGKPTVAFFQQVLASADCSAHQAILIGDDIDSDVGGAQRLEIFAALVKTGKYRASYHAESKIQPDLVLESVAELAQYLPEK